MLILSRKLDEQLMIGEDIRISVVEIKGDHVRLGIDAPKSIKVYRAEVYRAIQEENREAAQTGADLPNLDEFLPGKTDE
ncbi:MAG: carbon storage regulator [Spirochaetaceae bacterium]|nr:MAG: carbon storage regulator [Spirochaetaceae bacterium]